VELCTCCDIDSSFTMASHVEYIWVHPTSWGRADVIDASARWKAMSNGDDVMFGRDVCYLAPEDSWYPV
jgi:hypothetical protein